MAFNHKKEKVSINSAFNKAVKGTNRKLAEAYKKGLDEIRLELARIYEKHSKAGVLTLSEMSRYNRLNNLNKSVLETLKIMNVKATRKIETLSGNVYQESFFREGYIINNLSDININYGILSNEIFIFHQAVLHEARDNLE